MIAALLLLALPQATATPSIGVFPPQVGTVLSAGAAVEAAEGAVRSHGALGLVSSSSFTTSVERAAAAGVRCVEVTPECIARIGAYAQIDFLLLVRATAGESASVRVDLVDCVSGQTVRSTQGDVGPPADRPAAVRELASAALSGEPPAGRVRVEVSTGEAAVFVDGAAVGAAPVEVELEIGDHELRVEDAAGAEAEDRVAVRAGKSSTVTLTPVAKATAASTDRPVSDGGDDGVVGGAGPPPLVFVGAGLLGAGLVGAMLSGIGAAVVAPDLDRRADVSAKAFNEAQLFGRALLGVGAAFLIVGVAGAGVAAVGLLGATE